jgi:hypothetical protein
MNRLLSWLDPFISAQPETKVVVIRHRDGAPVELMPRRGPRTIVQRIPRPYWENNGWIFYGDCYEGHYQTDYGSWLGEITVSPSGRIEVFIWSPPAELQNHSHWQCFMKRDDDWYGVHSPEPITDISAAIISVENIIAESFEL